MIDLTQFFAQFQVGFGLAIIALLLSLFFIIKFPGKKPAR